MTDSKGTYLYYGQPLRDGPLPPINAEGFIHPGDAILSPRPPDDQIEIARLWVKRFCRPRKMINKGIDSYVLKHVIERWDQATANRMGYISNGAVILAFLELGYRCKVCGINAAFNFDYIGPRVKGYYKGARPRIPYSVLDWWDAYWNEAGQGGTKNGGHRRGARQTWCSRKVSPQDEKLREIC